MTSKIERHYQLRRLSTFSWVKSELVISRASVFFKCWA